MSLHDLIGFLDDLKERKIPFQSLTESIDTKTPTGRAMWQMIGILAELERKRTTPPSNNFSGAQVSLNFF